MTEATDKSGRDLSPSWSLAKGGDIASPPGTQPERPASRMPGLVPEFQTLLKNELELIKTQLCAQTKAFEALSHSVTLLEQESRHQQGRIAQLEEELKFAVSASRGTTLQDMLQKRLQELWLVMAREMQGLNRSLDQKESSVENLSQEVLESKKILWEELEAVQVELRRIHQKLKAQDVDITRNLVSIKKMWENQGKCTKFLAQLKGRVSSGDASEEEEEAADRERGSDREARKESSRFPVHSALPSGSIWSDKRGPLRVKSRGSQLPQKGSPSISYLSDSALR